MNWVDWKVFYPVPPTPQGFLKKHLIETFITLAKYNAEISVEHIIRLATLIPYQKKKELEQYICLIWSIAKVKINKERILSNLTNNPSISVKNL